MGGLTLAKLAEVIGIRGAIAIGMAIALGLVMWRADAISESRDKWQSEAIETGLKLDVSNQSIEILEAELAKFIGAGKAAQIAQLAAIEAQAEDSAVLQAQADAIRAEMETIGEGDPCECSTPITIIDAEGL